MDVIEMAYPIDKEHLTTFARTRERDLMINALIDRVGKLRDEDPASLEDRLYTVENLLIDVLSRVPLPVIEPKVKI